MNYKCCVRALNKDGVEASLSLAPYLGNPVL